jgi:hypothetical protein
MSENPVIRFVTTSAGRVAYATQGAGPTLVCPAWWVSHVERDFAYPPFRRFFESLAERATVVRYDRAVPFAAGRDLAARIPGARFVPLGGRAHPPWEGGPDVAAEGGRFLAGSAPIDSAEPAACRLDTDNCELVIGEMRVPLTRLELGTLRYLEEHRSRVVQRAELIQHVWEQREAGSNVVEVVVRSLRRKLGAYAASIETVTGHGYRFRGFSKS